MCYDILYYLSICFTASDEVHLDVDCNEKLILVLKSEVITTFRRHREQNTYSTRKYVSIPLLRFPRHPTNNPV